MFPCKALWWIDASLELKNITPSLANVINDHVTRTCINLIQDRVDAIVEELRDESGRAFESDSILRLL